MKVIVINVERTLLNLLQGDGVDNYWKWIEQGLLPSLSSSNRDWAVGCQPLEEYTIDCNSRLVGGARIRQLRIKPGCNEAAIKYLMGLH